MPGPGGSGGGFGGGSRGGFGGGSHGGFGGGFGGGHRPHGPHFHGPHFGGWFFRPRFFGYGYGGGCLGGLFGAIFVPIIFILIISMMLFGSFGNALGNVASGGSVVYDEGVMQDYADEQYSREFAAYENYDANLLFVLLTNEEYDGYYAISWVGYDLKTSVYNLFGDDRTVFGQTVLSGVNEYYEYSLSKDLALIMDSLAERITMVNDGSSYNTEPVYKGERPTSHLTNKTEMNLSEELVNEALIDFTARTGIPAVIVVDEMEEAIGKSLLIQDIILVIILISLIVLVVVMIVKAVKDRKKRDRSGDDRYGDNNRYGGGYYDGTQF